MSQNTNLIDIKKALESAVELLETAIAALGSAAVEEPKETEDDDPDEKPIVISVFPGSRWNVSITEKLPGTYGKARFTPKPTITEDDGA